MAKSKAVKSSSYRQNMSRLWIEFWALLPMMIRLCSIPCSISDFLTPFPSERKSGKTFSHLPPMWIKKSPQQQRRLTILEWSHQTIHTTFQSKPKYKNTIRCGEKLWSSKRIRCPADSAWWTSGSSNAHAPGAEGWLQYESWDKSHHCPSLLIWRGSFGIIQEWCASPL